MHCQLALEKCHDSMENVSDTVIFLFNLLLISFVTNLLCARYCVLRSYPKRINCAIQTEPDIIQILINPDDSIQVLSLSSDLDHDDITHT
jgi:hypothetical protein